MKITPLPQTKPLIQQFHLENFPLPYSNALRRSLHADVQTLAFDKAQFIQYDSEIPAEIIAHRIGLLPIFSDAFTLSSISPYYNCPNASSSNHSLDCQQCSIKAKIQIQASDKYMITDRDIQFERSEFQMFSIRNQTDPVPILLLAPNQSVEIELFAFKAPGRVHAKYSPVSAVSLVPRAKIDVSRLQNVLEDQKTADFLVQICPKNVFVFRNGRLQLVDSAACSFCDACARTPFGDINHPVAVEADYADMLLTVESAGGMDCLEIVKQGLLSVKGRLDEIAGSENFNNLMGEVIGVGEGGVGEDDDVL
ncbi:DNA-directed RNA polymerase RPB3 [Spironucleus salmonicida]|uniref:DNA-directed RNA polymerase RPB3 n=1 Tax=Spironucleus salmonicida TaxID=348837 RepID=V6LPE8_9EUKA|nr:DNA-directed RNA polymerase RPB3 [Spironucleus salmonicida]|eukprot:EST45591.1 DNA-directed RNA polymerase RPB3 [Spironucleus salmonicida]